MSRDSRIRSALDRIDWDFVDYVPGTGYPSIHAVHWYPAPFPPALVGTIIDVLGSGGLYLDPYSGSGVGPVEAWLRGYEAVGIDVNSFAVAIGNAKAMLLRDAEAETGRKLADDYMKFRSQTTARVRWNDRTIGAECGRTGIHQDATRWFTPNTLSELATIKDWLNTSALVQPWRDPVTILISSMLHKQFSELRDVHYTYIVDRSRTKEPPLDTVDVARALHERLRRVFITFEVTRIRLQHAGVDVGSQSPPTFIRGSSESTLPTFAKQIDLVVTSPPYFGMNDYVRSQYLSWLIFPWPSFESDLSEEVGSRRDRRNPKRLDAYLDSMRKTFGALHAALHHDAYVAVILGSSHSSVARSRNIVDDLDRSLQDVGFQFVWRGSRRVRYRKINNTPYRHEQIWILRK